MDLPSPARLIVALVALALTLPASAAARTGRAPVRPDAHELHVRIDPVGSRIEGTDVLRFPHRATLDLRLHPGLALTHASVGGASVLEALSPQPDSAGRLLAWRVPRSAAGPEGEVVLTLTFAGAASGQVLAEDLASPGAGRTAAVTAEGALLRAGAAWHPDTDRPAVFDATFDVPAAWRVVAGEERLEPATAAPAGRRFERALTTHPGLGLGAVAAPWMMTTVQHGDVALSAFVPPALEGSAARLVAAFAAGIEGEVARLGPFPWPKLDVALSPWGRLAGMRGAVLLDRSVLAGEATGLGPGPVVHELARAWWGQLVAADPAGSDWTEGLALLLGEHAAAEREGRGPDLRREACQRWSVTFARTDNAPLTRSLEKPTDEQRVATHAQAALALHDLERRAGVAAFADGLRAVLATHAGDSASWDDLVRAVSREAGRDLAPDFAHWLLRAGLPRLALAEVAHSGDAITGVIVQDGVPRNLTLDLRVTDADGTSATVTVSARLARTPFRLPAGASPVRVELDPEWHVARRIAAEDLPPCLGLTLAGDPEGRPPLLIYPEPMPDAPPDVKERFGAYRQFATDGAARTGGTAMAARVVAVAEFAGAPVVAFGSPSENRWSAHLAEAARAEGVDLRGTGTFRAGDRRFAGRDAAILVSVRHPERPGSWATVFAANGNEGLLAVRPAFAERWATWVSVAGGHVADRAPRRAGGATVVEFPPPDTASVRLLATRALLCASALEGRDAGTVGAAEAATLASTLLGAAGAVPLPERGDLLQLFAFDQVDVRGRPVLRMDEGDGQTTFAAVMPAVFSVRLPEAIRRTGAAVSFVPPPATEPAVLAFPGGIVFAGDLREGCFSGLDLAGALAAVVERSPPDTPGLTERHAGLLDEARLRNGAGVLVLFEGAEPPFFEGTGVFASQPGARVAAEFLQLRRAGGERAVQRAAAALNVDAWQPAREATIPLLHGGSDVLRALARAGADTRGRRAFAGDRLDARWQVFGERLADRNVAGILPGASGREGQAVLLAAPLDGPGLSADGRVRPGASRAGALAVVLEVARRLGERPAAGPVVILGLGAGLWGERGAREAAAALSVPVSAAIVLDSVGDALRLATGPAAGRVAGALDAALAEGNLRADHADFRADHLALAARGIPAVALACTEPASPPDATRDARDGEALARVADAVESAVRVLASP